jgi:hypothetical protein
MQLAVMPFLVPKLGEQKLLIIALVASCGHVRVLLCSIYVIFVSRKNSSDSLV